MEANGKQRINEQTTLGFVQNFLGDTDYSVICSATFVCSTKCSVNIAREVSGKMVPSATQEKIRGCAGLADELRSDSRIKRKA